ncbi:signal-induced proliferation-associated 1-like protein 2 [Planococcus citri]|uniref:signal-induced proliferation-associated 1-like protein 2 n=1 Tax=Planococcus citri TaxID=170843 RepID=UPI0031F7DA9B
MIEVDEGVSSSRGTARDRAAQAIHYYNNNVLKARTGSRSSAYSYQQHQRIRGGAAAATAAFNSRTDNLYRSNSSLELLHDSNLNECHRNRLENVVTPTLKREYGSHGSIDVIAAAAVVDQKDDRDLAREQFFSMLQDYKPAVFDLIKPTRSLYDSKPSSADYASVLENGRRTETQLTAGSSRLPIEDEYSLSTNKTNHISTTVATSPKPKSKFSKFWSSSSNMNSSSGGSGGGGSAVNCMGGGSSKNANDSPTELSSQATQSNCTAGAAGGSVEVDEKQRRRAFAHYDCQSLIAKLGYGGKLKSLLSKRRNTTTGASAASMLSGRSTTPDGDSGEEDAGDGRSNELLESCPFFRNEIGGEEERVVSLTRSYSPSYTKHWKDPHHRPPLSCGVSILEYPVGETHWKNGACPYRRNTKTIENVDEGAQYYRKYFFKQDHQNWFGADESLGPVAISIKREKVDAVVQSENSGGGSSSTATNGSNSVTQLCRYRLIVRTSELQTLRGSVLEDAIPNLKPSHSVKNINTKEVLEYVIPEIQLSCLRLGMNTPQVEDQLLKLDEQGISRHYKIGVLYCRAGQATEEEMYNNEDGGPAFNEFLETIGQKVRLKGFDKYKAGLDNKSDSTGLYSVYAHYKDCEIMFHVSTMLPFTPNNRQQLLRKRHIGNDIVTIVFQEPGAQPFTPKNIRSQFQHVFIVVRAINPCTDCTQYRIAVTRSKDVALFGPPIPKGAIFNKSKNFADFLLAKVINGENAAHCSDKFATMATRTRQAYLKDLTTNYATNTVLESSQKFSIISFSSKKKERWRPRFVPDGTQRGAICWQVLLEDSNQSIIIHCFLAVSADSLVLVDESTNNIVFVTPCKSILGWSTQTNSLRLYYHEGECVTMHMRESGDRDELMEVVVRLRSVTSGSAAQELSLKRNAVGQLGFHVQLDGVVTQVEPMGLAWQAGLRQGARLVEICKVAVATLTHDQMVDLLKTSLMVTVTVIPSLPDGAPRRGCSVQNCKYSSINDKEDYDSCSSPEDQKLLLHNPASLQQPVIGGKHKKMYERSFSPPRSSNSSGYGTGSSNKSFNGNDNKLNANAVNNNNCPNINANKISPNCNVLMNGGGVGGSGSGESLMNSISSAQTTEDSWYDVLDTEGVPTNVRNNMSPPPLPARILSSVTPNSNRMPYKYSSHTKMKMNSSLPLSNVNSSYSLPVLLTNDSDLDYVKSRDFITGEKVTCLMKAERSHKVRRQLEQKMPHPSLKVDDYCTRSEMSSSLPPETLKTLSASDGHSTDTSSTSEKAFPPSEDELSIDSVGNASPKLRSTVTKSNASSSNGCSRNNSPRLKDTGEPRLRPGAGSRSSNRNSANLTSSTLQQDLMKLINPDYATEDNNCDISEPSQQSGNYSIIQNEYSTDPSTEDDKCVKTKSKENISTPQKANLKNGCASNSVIVTTARPATVIFNGSTSSQPKDNVLSKEERLSLRVTNVSNSKHDPPCLPLPDTKEMDWPSLVDTATKAMLQTANEENSSSLLSSNQTDDDFHWIDSSDEFHFSMTPGVENKKNIQQQFQKYLSELENRLMKETQLRLTLEQEVHSLRDENRRLQQESQSAAQQLRRFTEWFFQTIDKQ